MAGYGTFFHIIIIRQHQLANRQAAVRNFAQLGAGAFNFRYARAVKTRRSQPSETIADQARRDELN